MFEKMQGRRTQFYIDVLYGVLFFVSVVYLIYEMTPLAAGFVGGIVIGYFLHVWEKMVTYEQILEERVSAEAERQVSTEVDEQVGDMDERIEERVGEVESRVGEVEEEVEEIEEEVNGSE